MWGIRGTARLVAGVLLMLGFLVGSLNHAAAQDATPVPGDTSQVTISISSSDPSVTSMPEGSWWSVSGTTGGGTVASGDLSGDQLELPTTIVIDTPVPYGEYLVTVGATWVFAPYEQVHTVDSPTQTLGVVLDPYVEQPVAASLSVVMEDGSEADVSMRWALDDAESKENIAGGTGTYSIPTTLWEGELMPGDYWVSIYPDGDYAAISELVTVTPRVPSAPFEFTLVPTGTEPTAEPTETPTAEPTHADKDKDDKHKHDDKDDKKEKEEVKTLPSTGQGRDTGPGNGLLAMVLGGISLLLMVASLAWHQRRSEG